MTAARTIPESVRDRQALASDPAASVWVAANAGAGKTHVLAQRVIRLLLDGVAPAKILCITFTKAAAANMANRVFGALAHWTTLDDAALTEALRQAGVRAVDSKLLARARRLFALALETPGGLKVQTIHAFCTHLLHQFPFEANVAARFEVLDEAAEAQMLQQLTVDVLLAAAAEPDGPLGKALAATITAAADQTFREMVAEAIGERDRLTAWLDAAGGVDAAIRQLSAALGIDPDDTLEAIEAELFDRSLITEDEWPAVASVLADGRDSDLKQSVRFLALAERDGSARRDTYLEIFCTAKLEPRKHIVTKIIRESHPELFEKLVAEQQRVCALLDRRRAVAARDRTRALVTIADAVLTRYRAEKERRGLLDYNDQIDKALALLETASPTWVQYKLDRGIDHVLIDEAQDTSPKQWAIIRALVSEFFAGAGARTGRRTVFAVGDEKQSIFSFQGAAPREFDRMWREFQRMAMAIDHEFRHVRFDHSFRSGANVLAAVDGVFQEQSIYVSVTSDEVAPRHLALPDAAPGLVEIWDTEKPSEKREIEAWDAPFDLVSETSPVARLADRIAASTAAWQRQGYAAGDILVLVHRRGPLFEAIIRALRNRGIAVAGADRLVLTEHIAVMDLMVLADALLLPDDDLALATALKSPLFGFTDDDLIRIAWNRGRRSLREALLRQSDPRTQAVAKQLDRLADAARRDSPFAFYARLLGAEDGRRRFLERLGHEAGDALDEFLNLALDYERSETPSLQGFVAWLRAARSEIKRDMEIARDEVRVMTVHGAKGLEAKIVVLADTTSPPHGWHPPRLLTLPAPGSAAGAPPCLVWAGPKQDDVASMKTAREAELNAMQDEYRRLLYVAMTRAAEQLVVCGVDGRNSRPEGCWYDLVRTALEPEASKEPADDGSGHVLRYRKVPDDRPTAGPSMAPPNGDRDPLPDWLVQDVAAESPPPAPLAPSRATAEATTAGASERTGAARRRALARGIAMHRLIQSLPDVPAARRADAARRFLVRRRAFDDAECEAMIERVLAVLSDPRFAPLFGPGSRAEIPIVGRWRGRPVSGTVDRLAVTSDKVLIADYKTNRPAPRSLDEAKIHHGAYIAQLALYRAVLASLYPDRRVVAALLWTETPELMEIPAADLDAALEAL